MGGVSHSIYVLVSIRTWPSIGQVEHSDARYRSERWTSASSPPSSRSPTTARSRRRRGRCTRCSPTSPATSPASRRSSATTLVDRAQGGLTDDGARVVERARRILREMDDIAADVAPVNGDVTGDVRIGILGTTARWLLPRLLPALADTPPARPGHRLRRAARRSSSRPCSPGRFNARHHPPPRRRPRADDRAAVRRGPAARRPGRPSTRRPRRDPARRARRVPPAPAPAGSALRRVLDRAARSVGVQLARPGRDRRRAPARHAGHRRPRRGDRPGDRGPPRGRRRHRGVRVPELRPAWSPSPTTAGRRPSAPARALFEVLRDVVPPGPPISPGCGSAPRRSRSAVPSELDRARR